MTARFRGRNGKLTVIQTFAPRKDAEEEEKGDAQGRVWDKHQKRERKGGGVGGVSS